MNISKCISYWKRRKLTPIGKITVAKSIFVPLLTHLFISLPFPKADFLKGLNDLVYNFIWDGKATIKRSLLTKMYEDGGLKIIGIKRFNSNMKSKWLKSLISQCKQTKCYELINNIIDISKIINLGKTYSEFMSNKAKK